MQHACVRVAMVCFWYDVCWKHGQQRKAARRRELTKLRESRRLRALRIQGRITKARRRTRLYDASMCLPRNTIFRASAEVALRESRRRAASAELCIIPIAAAEHTDHGAGFLIPILRSPIRRQRSEPVRDPGQRTVRIVVMADTLPRNACTLLPDCGHICSEPLFRAAAQVPTRSHCFKSCILHQLRTTRP